MKVPIQPRSRRSRPIFHVTNRGLKQEHNIMVQFWKLIVTIMYTLHSFSVVSTVHCCGLQVDVNLSFQLLFLSGCTCLSSQSILLETYIVDPCSSWSPSSSFAFQVFLQSILFSAEYHKALMCFSLYGPSAYFLFFRLFIIIVSFTPIFCSTSIYSYVI